MALTPEKIETYHPAHLIEIGEWIGQQYPRWDSHFIDQHNDLQGMGHLGVNSEKTVADAAQDVLHASTLTGAATAAQTTALDGVTSLMTMQGMAVTALESARLTGFSVDEQFGVKDVLPPTPETQQARQKLATEHANNIAHHVGNFQKAQQTLAQVLRAHGQTLQSHMNGGGNASMMDSHFKTGGGDDPVEPSMPSVDAPGDDIFIGTGGAASTQSGLGVEDTRLPAMPKEWPPKAPVVTPPAPCGVGEFARDTFDVTAADAATTAAALLFPFEGPAMIPSAIAIAKGLETIATTSETEIDCIERGFG